MWFFSSKVLSLARKRIITFSNNLILVKAVIEVLGDIVTSSLHLSPGEGMAQLQE